MKKVLSVFLSLILIITSTCIFPLTSFAKENDGCIFSYTAKELYTMQRKTGNIYPKLKSSKDATVQSEIIGMRDALVQRQSKYSIAIDLNLSSDALTNYLLNIFYGAIAIDNSQTSVDAQYAQYHLGGIETRAEYINGKPYATFYFKYRSNAKEEIEVNNIIKKFFSSVNVNNISDYELVKRIHDFVINSCTYSDDFNKDSVYTAWGALCDGDTVCEGYALAFYRLCKEAGIDAVMDISDPDEGCHAWNVVNLGGKCYYVDPTWDDNMYEANQGAYNYFLVDYDTLRSQDSSIEEHTNYIDQTNYSYLNSNYFSKVDNKPFSTSSNVISNCTVTIAPNGISVKDKNGRVLIQNVDYTISNDSFGNVKVNGIGNYSGYSVRKTQIFNRSYSIASPVQITSKYVMPEMNISDLCAGNDYLLYCFNNDSVGTGVAMAYGIGKYTGFIQNTFYITKGNINNFDIKLEYTSTLYDGTVKKPSVTVGDLVEGEDYTVSYSNNVDAGVAYVTINGIGNFEGTVQKTFTISKPNIADLSMNLDSSIFEYTGSPIMPKVNVFGCVEGVDYTLSYANNIEVGTASVTVNGIGYYSGSKTLYFTINAKPSTTQPSQTPTATVSPKKVTKPKKVTLSKLKTSKKSITAYWKKVSCSGYQIEYSTNKNFKKSKKVTVKSAKTTSKKISKIKKGKKYYFRVRAYKNSDGKKIYGAWSKVKSVKCK